MARPISSIALATAFLAGCGSGDETDYYSLVAVSGNVTLDGKPLAGAKVMFTPSDENKPNTPGVDVTGQEGNFKLMYRGRSGVAPGKYKVFVNKTVEPGNMEIPEEYKDNPMLAGMAKQGAMIAQGAALGRKAAASANVNSSFDREVGAKGEIFDFDIKAPAKKN